MEAILKTLNKRKGKNGLLILFIVLSFVMFNVAGLVNIPGIIEHPQYDKYTDSNLIEILLNKEFWLRFWYYVFFVIDFIWLALLLLLLNWYMVERYKEDGKKYPKWLVILFFTLSVIAYVFNVIENIGYLQFARNEWVIFMKIGLYGILLVVILVAILEKAIRKGYISMLIQFVKAAAYSLLILLIIGVLLPKAPQVNSIVVDLYLKPYNLLVLFFFLSFFATAIAHYPSYFHGQKNKRVWFMAEKRILKVIGIVYYRNEPTSKGTRTHEIFLRTAKINFLFRALGICFYATVFYVISYSSEVNYNWPVDMSRVSISIMFLSIVLLYYLKEYKNEWYRINYPFLKDRLKEFYDGDYEGADDEKPTVIETEEKRGLFGFDYKARLAKGEYGPIRTPVLIYIWLFVVTLKLHACLFIFLFLDADSRYTEPVIYLSLLCILGQLSTYIFYRSFRSVLRIVLFNRSYKKIVNSFLIDPREKESNGRKAREELLSFFKEMDITKGNPLLVWLKKVGFGRFSNNILFLRINAIVGVFNFLFLFVINCNSTYALEWNAFLIILSYLYFGYGILIVFTKTLIYHRYRVGRGENPNGQSHIDNNNSRNQKVSTRRVIETDKKRYRRFQLLTASIIVVLFGLYVITKTAGNGLTTLPTTSPVEGKVLFKDYIDGFDKAQTRYYVGCYGGGMKSNAWTMTILNELYNRDSMVITNSVGVSGVSGGTMGIMNFLAILKKNQLRRDGKSRQNLVTRVATENILSMDITHVLGRDMLMYLFYPFNATGKDRSTKVMQTYAGLTKNGMHGSFRGQWQELYDQFDGRFPIYIANTTNVKGRQGMAFSIELGPKESDVADIIYQGADNILDIEEFSVESDRPQKKTLGYYEASSTSNRFPGISATAKIETKGHYNDGGIFENSGLLSLYKLFKAINYQTGVESINGLDQKNVFVSLINDKNQYIKAYLNKALRKKNLKLNREEVNYTSELKSIIRSVAATEMFPAYVKEELQRMERKYPEKVEYIPIYLPHKFFVSDIKRIYGKKLRLNGKWDDGELLEIVNANNKTIDSLIDPELKKPVIEPPMSRVMAEPAYDFMVQMLRHPMVRESITKVTTE